MPMNLAHAERMGETVDEGNLLRSGPTTCCMHKPYPWKLANGMSSFFVAAQLLSMCVVAKTGHPLGGRRRALGRAIRKKTGNINNYLYAYMSYGA